MFTMNRSGAGIWKAILALSAASSMSLTGTAPRPARFNPRKRKAYTITTSSRYQPHQGKAERARRVRQMQEWKCIDPAAQVNYMACVGLGNFGGL